MAQAVNENVYLKKTIYWLQEASNQNFIPAQYHLGVLLYDSCFDHTTFVIDSMVMNRCDAVQKSLSLLRNAAMQGHSGAQFLLGKMYYSGIRSEEIEIGCNMNEAKK